MAAWASSSSCTWSTWPRRPAPARVDRDRSGSSPVCPRCRRAARSRSSPGARSSCPRRRAPTSSAPWPPCGPTGRCSARPLARGRLRRRTRSGADPARPVQRVNPGARYAAMEQHFDALGCAGSGHGDDVGHRRAAGQPRRRPRRGLGAAARHWCARWSRAGRARRPPRRTSAGGRSGWHSMRQGTWQGIDHGRSDPFSGASRRRPGRSTPCSAPVMLVRDGTAMVPVTRPGVVRRVAAGRRAGRRGRPTVADLDYHLTTLFPPVRPRGYVEIRCIDALPDRWWPAVAAVTATLVDDPVAADLAAELCAPVADAWESAARVRHRRARRTTRPSSAVSTSPPGAARRALKRRGRGARRAVRLRPHPQR